MTHKYKKKKFNLSSNKMQIKSQIVHFLKKFPSAWEFSTNMWRNE